MELKGETLIAAPREAVWAALNDPDVLARCIDGVETLTRSGDNRFEGKMNAKVGPVRATFTGAVTLENLDPPNGYTLVGEGKGGVAGFAKGAAEVVLADAAGDGGGAATLLTYHAKSTVGGKLAQLGARLIEGTAKSYAESFFAKLKAELEGGATRDIPPQAGMPNVGIGSDAGESVAAAAAASGSESATAPRTDSEGLSPLAWGFMVAALCAALVIALLMTS